MDQCGICDIHSVLGMLWVPVDMLDIAHCASWAPWMFVSGESSTRTLFMRVMETFDDDDDDDTYIHTFWEIYDRYSDFIFTDHLFLYCLFRRQGFRNFIPENLLYL